MSLYCSGIGVSRICNIDKEVAAAIQNVQFLSTCTLCCMPMTDRRITISNGISSTSRLNCTLASSWSQNQNQQGQQPRTHTWVSLLHLPLSVHVCPAQPQLQQAITLLYQTC